MYESTVEYEFMFEYTVATEPVLFSKQNGVRLVGSDVNYGDCFAELVRLAQPSLPQWQAKH